MFGSISFQPKFHQANQRSVSSYDNIASRKSVMLLTHRQTVSPDHHISFLEVACLACHLYGSRDNALSHLPAVRPSFSRTQPLPTCLPCLSQHFSSNSIPTRCSPASRVPHLTPQRRYWYSASCRNRCQVRRVSCLRHFIMSISWLLRCRRHPTKSRPVVPLVLL
jgi:hypothetical protein